MTFSRSFGRSTLPQPREIVYTLEKKKPPREDLSPLREAVPFQRCGAPTARQRRSVSPLVSHHFRMSLWITQLQNASTPNNKQNTLRIYTHIQKNNRVAQCRCPVFFSISLAVVQSAHIEKSQLTAVIRGRLCFATNGRMAKNHIGYGAKNGIANMVRTMVATVSKNHFLC